MTMADHVSRYPLGASVRNLKVGSTLSLIYNHRHPIPILSIPYTIMPLEHVADLPGHTDPAWAVAFNPTRPIIASCSTDRTVRLYQYHLESNPPRVEYLKTISTNHTKSIRSISWAPSGKTLATGSFDSSVAVWEEVDPDQEDGEGVERRGDESGSGEKEWECVTTLEGHESECKSVAFSSDGALLASCSRDKSVWVWEGESFRIGFRPGCL